MFLMLDLTMAINVNWSHHHGGHTGWHATLPALVLSHLVQLVTPQGVHGEQAWSRASVARRRASVARRPESRARCSVQPLTGCDLDIEVKGMKT